MSSYCFRGTSGYVFKQCKRFSRNNIATLFFKLTARIIPFSSRRGVGVIQVEELSNFLGLSMGGSLFEGGAYSRGGGAK